MNETLANWLLKTVKGYDFNSWPMNYYRGLITDLLNGTNKKLKIIKRRYLFLFWFLATFDERNKYRILKLIKKTKLYNVKFIEKYNMDNSRTNIIYRHYIYEITKKENKE